MIAHLRIATRSQGLHEFTSDVAAAVHESGIAEGLCTLFVRHTSASLLVQENADPDVQHDLEHWFNRFAPEGDALYTHVNEGPHDMPGHIKAALTATTISIPIVDGQLTLWQWQGIIHWEHRRGRSEREVIVHVGS